MKNNNNTKLMTGILMIVFVAMFMIIAGRFIYIQAKGEIDGVSLKEWAEEQRKSSYVLKASRGKIFDAKGMPLAADRLTYRMYAIIDEDFSRGAKEKKHVDDVEGTAEALAPILETDEAFLIEQIENGKEKGSFQVEFGKVGRELSQKTKVAIEELKLPGIQFDEEPVRYYPNGVFASHIIGFAQKNNETEELHGVTGIEKDLDELLSGKNGEVSYQRDLYNKKLLDPDEVVQKPLDGHDVYLTIEQKIQTLLDDAMTEVESTYEPERITAVVMNAKTGEIVAMSNRPSYDPNYPADVENWYNDVISSPFEPGSTVKMFTWAAAIDAGVYEGSELFKSGRYQINQRIEPIGDHNQGEGWGTISYDEGFARSSNVAASKLVWEELGPEKFLEYLEAFDFDKKTSIDLPGEIPGRILYNWPLEKITTSFGQGSTMTPIQQIKAASAFANGGKMLQPYVIDKIVDPNTGEIIEEKEPKVVGEPISEQTAAEVIDLLDLVVNSEEGTGQMYQLDSYSAIGKTGTAEIPDPKGETAYLTGKNNYVFSFLGMAPKDDPELIMHISVKQPKLDDGESGSAPVSYIFRNVMENGLHYLNIEPDQEENQEAQVVKLPNLINENVEQVYQLLTEQGLRVSIVGKGERIQEASARQGTELLINDRLILITEEPTMPDVTGWSYREILLFAEMLDMKLETIGNGYVVKQSVEEGMELKENDYLAVELLPPTEKPKPEEEKKEERQE
ncbi:penicillin-binding transpeptidase domain-containing protein [Ornithinibacillus sp. 4-3]|uniref:serine-type D-Ala-D-Ala carboxypeptidase n=1 Tax=Ornithinibacillus sp. 4-3 TaxID=3231488 RepID=A0AB39HU49_9BACI